MNCSPFSGVRIGLQVIPYILLTLKTTMLITPSIINDMLVSYSECTSKKYCVSDGQEEDEDPLATVKLNSIFSSQNKHVILMSHFPISLFHCLHCIHQRGQHTSFVGVLVMKKVTASLQSPCLDHTSSDRLTEVRIHQAS